MSGCCEITTDPFYYDTDTYPKTRGSPDVDYSPDWGFWRKVVKKYRNDWGENISDDGKFLSFKVLDTGEPVDWNTFVEWARRVY